MRYEVVWERKYRNVCVHHYWDWFPFSRITDRHVCMAWNYYCKSNLVICGGVARRIPVANDPFGSLSEIASNLCLISEPQTCIMNGIPSLVIWCYCVVSCSIRTFTRNLLAYTYIYRPTNNQFSLARFVCKPTRTGCIPPAAVYRRPPVYNWEPAGLTQLIPYFQPVQK